MVKRNLITLLSMMLLMSIISYARPVTLRGKITLTVGSMPATAILHSTADESFVGTSNVDKDGVFSFTVDVPKATLFNVRLLHITYDVLLSAAQPLTNLSVTLDGSTLKDIRVEKSSEDDAFKAFRAIALSYDTKLRAQVVDCEKPETCEKAMHDLLADYAEELTGIQQKYKATYTADVLCKMKMPTVAKNQKNTSEEYRKNYFSNVDFSDSTIFATPVFRDMISNYVDYIVEPSYSKEGQFITYFTEKTKANPVVLRKSANTLFDELFRKQKEKMLAMYIDWYNTGDNKALVNSPVMDLRLKNISKVLPGQPYINAVGPDVTGSQRSLKDVVDKSKCTLLLFWSSDCSHCRDEMPFIKEYYEKYHDKGLDVFAVSIEQDIEKWKAFVKDKQLVWTNILSSYRADPNPAIQYVSVSTPTLVLIDEKGIILHRFINKTKLEKYIIEALK